MFKNVFRSLKQHLTEWFKSKSSFYQITDSIVRRNNYRDYLREFITDHVLKAEGYEDFKEFEVEEIIDYFGRIINPRILSKTCQNFQWTQSIKAFNNCLYKFSDRNARRLYRNRFFYILFEWFSNSRDLFRTSTTENLEAKFHNNSLECDEHYIETFKIVQNKFIEAQASITA